MIPPPSKSYSHRYLFLALISKGPTRYSNFDLKIGDVKISGEVCKQLGMNIKVKPKNPTTIECIPPNELVSNAIHFRCGNSGTTVRFLVGLSLCIVGKITLSGEFFQKKRPILPMLEAMKKIGAEYSLDENSHRITLEIPKITSNIIEIPGNFSSQFVSGLMLGAAGLNLNPSIRKIKGLPDAEFIIKINPPVVSTPYIELTRHLVRDRLKIAIDRNYKDFYSVSLDRRKLNWPIEEIIVPGDYSSIAPILAAAVLFGKEDVEFNQFLRDEFQADKNFLSIIKRMGGFIKHQKAQLKIQINPKKILKGISINCRNYPDLFPISCVLGVYAEGKSKITKFEHVRYKESDRVEIMLRELKKLEINIRITRSGKTIYIVGPNKPKLRKDYVITGVEDHRILMALVILALGIEYNGYSLTIEHVDKIADSYPGFFNDLHHLGAQFKLENM
jgi:3-phosphoshikimate 1-carboxyvinyltransferase